MGSTSDTSKELVDSNKKVEDRIPGCLSVLKLDNSERDLLLDYLKVTNPNSFSDYIFSILGDSKFLSFYDVLEGLTVKVPSRQSMVKVINYIKIYSYLEKRNFSEEAYEKASKLFKKRVVSLKRIVIKVDGVLGRGSEISE